MEWRLKEDRAVVISLYKCGHPPDMVFKLLQNLKVNRHFVYGNINKYNGTLTVSDSKRSGRSQIVRRPAVIKAVKAKIAIKPVRKQKLMALQMSIKRSSPKKIINEEHGFRAYRMR